MTELHLTWIAAATVAACLTKGTSPGNAAHAHRLWLVVLATPLLWVAGAWLFAPAMFVAIKPGILPEAPTQAAAALRWLLTGVYVTVALTLLARTVASVAAVRRLVRLSPRLNETD